MFEERPYKIYYIQYDEDGNEIDRGVYHKEYKTFGMACNIARKNYGGHQAHRIGVDGRPLPFFEGQKYAWIVNWRDPFVEYHVEAKCDYCGKQYNRPQNYAGFDRGIHLELCDRAKGYRHKDNLLGTLCPECAEKIKNFVKSLGE